MTTNGRREWLYILMDFMMFVFAVGACGFCFLMMMALGLSQVGAGTAFTILMLACVWLWNECGKYKQCLREILCKGRPASTSRYYDDDEDSFFNGGW